MMKSIYIPHFSAVVFSSQRGTPWSDGAEMVTQCPIEPGGGRYIYQFKLDRPGTYFWHAHVGLQMDYGLVGVLLVHDPQDPHRCEGQGCVCNVHAAWLQFGTLCYQPPKGCS